MFAHHGGVVRDPPLEPRLTGPSSKHIRRSFPVQGSRSNVQKFNLYLICVLRLQHFCNRLQLDVTCALVNCPNLAVSPHLLGNALANESHPSHPLNSQSTHSLCHLRGVKLGHRCVLYERLSSFLLSCGIENECSCSRNFGIGLGNLVLHALEVTHQLAELLSVIPNIPDGC